MQNFDQKVKNIQVVNQYFRRQNMLSHPPQNTPNSLQGCCLSLGLKSMFFKKESKQPEKLEEKPEEATLKQKISIKKMAKKFNNNRISKSVPTNFAFNGQTPGTPMKQKHVVENMQIGIRPKVRFCSREKRQFNHNRGQESPRFHEVREMMGQKNLEKMPRSNNQGVKIKMRNSQGQKNGVLEGFIPPANTPFNSRVLLEQTKAKIDAGFHKYDEIKLNAIQNTTACRRDSNFCKTSMTTNSMTDNPKRSNLKDKSAYGMMVRMSNQPEPNSECKSMSRKRSFYEELENNCNSNSCNDNSIRKIVLSNKLSSKENKGWLEFKENERWTDQKLTQSKMKSVVSQEIDEDPISMKMLKIKKSSLHDRVDTVQSMMNNTESLKVSLVIPPRQSLQPKIGLSQTRRKQAILDIF